MQIYFWNQPLNSTEGNPLGGHVGLNNEMNDMFFSGSLRLKQHFCLPSGDAVEPVCLKTVDKDQLLLGASWWDNCRRENTPVNETSLVLAPTLRQCGGCKLKTKLEFYAGIIIYNVSEK